MTTVSLEKLLAFVEADAPFGDVTSEAVLDGGGWFLDIDHSDNGQTRQLHTKRGAVRVFKSADVAIRALHECSYVGPLAVVMKPEGN